MTDESCCRCEDFSDSCCAPLVFVNGYVPARDQTTATTAFTTADGIGVNTNSTQFLITPTSTSIGPSGYSNGTVVLVSNSQLNTFTLTSGAASVTVSDATSAMITGLINQTFVVTYFSTTLLRTIVELRDSVTLQVISSTNTISTSVVTAAHDAGYFIVGGSDGLLMVYGSDLQPVWQLSYTKPITAVGGSGCFLVVGLQSSSPSPLIAPSTIAAPSLIVYRIPKYKPKQKVIPSLKTVQSLSTGDSPSSVTSWNNMIFVAYPPGYWVQYAVECCKDDDCAETWSLQLCNVTSSGPNPTLSVVRYQMNPVLVVGSNASTLYNFITIWSFQ